MAACDGNKCLTGCSQINFLREDKDVLKISTKMLVTHTHTHTHTHTYINIYIYIYIYICVCLFICIYIYIYINCSLWIITTISESDINDNTLLKIKTMKFEFEECNIITDIILEYWSMEMLIQTEPGFTCFYSWKKTPGAQCPHPPPQHCLLWMWAAPPSICGWPLLHSKGLSLKGPKQECLCDL